MAALTGITSIRTTSNTQITPPVLYGATVAIGQPLYRDASDSSKHKLADADASVTAAAARGIALTEGVDGGYGVLATGGSVLVVGATLVVGTTYYVGPTAGEIIPEDDLGSGDFPTRLGIASTSSQLDLLIIPGTAARP